VKNDMLNTQVLALTINELSTPIIGQTILTKSIIKMVGPNF